MDRVSDRTSFGAIDIGSHTVRLLIAACRDGKEVTPVHSERHVTRLATGFKETGSLSRASMQWSMDVIKHYKELLAQHNVCSTNAGATGVVRRACNNHELLRAISDEAGIQAKIISEEEEAFISARGVLSALGAHISDIVLIFDLGGSSTEFLLVKPTQSTPLWSTSVFIGAATVTERFMPGETVDSLSLSHAEEAISEALAPTFSEVRERIRQTGKRPEQISTIGTAGTVTTLAAMYLEMPVYQPYRVSGVKLNADYIEETAVRLATMPISFRSQLKGLEKGREDIILGGTLVVREILRGLGHDTLTVSDAGFLEGLLLDAIESEYNLQRTLVTPLMWKRYGG